nr:hypothetical protein [Ensifer sp. LCM 4579]
MLGITRSSVQDNLDRAKVAGLAWPVPGDLTDDVLAARLFACAGFKQGQRRRVEPNWAELSIELKEPGVTLLILWEEYRASTPTATATAASASCFAISSSAFRRRCTTSMRPATRCWWTIPARRCRSSIARPARFARRFCSSACSARRATTSPSRPGPSPCRTGSARMGGCSPFSAACPVWSCPTI